MSDRDLDAEIVETIFGWTPARVSADANGENASEVLAPNGVLTQEDCSTMPLVGKVHRGWKAPRYASDMYHAIQLCKHVGYKQTVDLYDVQSLKPRQLAEAALAHYKSTHSG